MPANCAPFVYWGKETYILKTKNREQEGFPEHWRGGEGGLGSEQSWIRGSTLKQVKPCPRLLPVPSTGRSSHPVRSFHLQPMLFVLPSLSLWSRLSSVLSTPFLLASADERGVIPSDLSPHQEQQLREALTKACGSNVNPLSSRELVGMLCK